MEVAEALLAHAMACPAVDEQEQVAQALLGHVTGDLEVSAESGSKEEKDEEKEQEPASLEQDPAEETREEPREEPHEEPHEQPHEEEERPQELEESTVAPQSQAQDLESPHWLEVELSPDLQGQVDAFTERLREATTTFNHSTGDDGSYDVDEFLFSAGGLVLRKLGWESYGRLFRNAQARCLGLGSFHPKWLLSGRPLLFWAFMIAY